MAKICSSFLEVDDDDDDCCRCDGGFRLSVVDDSASLLFLDPEAESAAVGGSVET